ncbi:DUF3558 domain-containing protein [Saccharopolyspora erythraea]|nr:DUF3558 domain-containing protein [Saccharopolyspora erythraea]QRK89488.1 DUF3558 domain-containing protein [Saccharopolyspora erythraea]
MRTTRTTVAAVLASAGLLLAGCGGPSAGPTPTSEGPKEPGLANFDPCTALSAEQLQAQGVEAPGAPVDQGVGEVGCDFDSEDLVLTLLKADGRDLSYWEGRRNNFDKFENNQVASRRGISGVAAGGMGQGVCRQIVEAGGGSVIAQVTYSSDQIQGNDPCAKALEIAQQIEPKLPK